MFIICLKQIFLNTTDFGDTKKLAVVDPRGYIRKVYYLNEIYTKLRHNLPSICDIEINRKIINPSSRKPEIVPYFYLLKNCVNVSFIHFYHVHYLFLGYVRHSLKHVVIFFVLYGAPFGPAPQAAA